MWGLASRGEAMGWCSEVRLWHDAEARDGHLRFPSSFPPGAEGPVASLLEDTGSPLSEVADTCLAKQSVKPPPALPPRAGGVLLFLPLDTISWQSDFFFERLIRGGNGILSA